MYIDSHAHIYLSEFEETLPDILKKCNDDGVANIYMPNIDSSSIASLHEVESNYDSCKAMMGLHPCYVKSNYLEELSIVESWLAKREYAAIGEVGVDLYWDKTHVDEQLNAFRRQISLGLEYDLAIIIHSRDSLDITIEEITKAQNGNLRGIFHCFNGTEEQARKIQDIGFMVGIGGVLTFKNAGVDKTVANLSIDNMVLETDAPYLAPVPYRGKQNSPSYIPLIAEKLSEVLELSLPEIASKTTSNCREVFKY